MDAMTKPSLRKVLNDVVDEFLSRVDFDFEFKPVALNIDSSLTDEELDIMWDMFSFGEFDRP